MTNLLALRSTLNNSGLQQTNNALYQVIDAILSNLARGQEVIPPTYEWESYTPIWKGAGSDPAINNGSLLGYFTTISNLCLFRIRMDAGSGTTFGTGAWSFSLPAVATGAFVFPGEAVDAAVAIYPLIGVMNSINTFVPFTTASPGVAVTSAVPFAWGTSDAFIINGFFQLG